MLTSFLVEDVEQVADFVFRAGQDAGGRDASGAKCTGEVSQLKRLSSGGEKDTEAYPRNSVGAFL